jgi:predicted O-linked N-acetylglucosamine transferase (SPINDLY family)
VIEAGIPSHVDEPDAPAPESDFQHGQTLHQQGRLAEAERVYHAVLRQHPTHTEAWHCLGVIALQTGRLEQAIELIGKAIALREPVAATHNNRGIALWQLGRREAALTSFDRTLELDPDAAETHANRAVVLLELGRPGEALAGFDRAIGLRPDHTDAHANRGLLLWKTSRLSEALASFDAAIALEPDYAAAHQHRGNILRQLGRAEDALASFDTAIALDPDHAATHGDRGDILRQLGRPTDALASYDRAIGLHTNDAGIHFSRGELLRLDGRADAAVASMEAGLAVDRTHGACWLGSCFAQLPILYRTEAEIPLRRQRYMAALRRLEAATADPAVRRSVAEAIGPSPFYLPYQGENDVEPQSAYGGLAARLLAATWPPAPVAPRPDAGARIRLGIVSGFFRDHTVFKMFLEGWLTELDRDRFEVIGFHTGATADGITAWASARCDRFVRDLPSRSAWRQAIEDAAPHVLIYPEVGMDPMVGWLAPQRLARVQCVAWGHPVTTGMPTLDYFLSSELMEPADADAHYTEQLVRLPGLGLHFTPDQRSAAPVDRAALGLDPAVPVFWSGQSLFKYLPRHDSLFPRIAAAVGPCQFAFVGNVSPGVTEMFRERLGVAFAAVGLAAERYCVILPPMPFARYIGAVGLADVVLDTPDWTGGKSTLDCLAQNPAIVTIPGRFMRGRQSGAILRHIGCEATIASSADDYVAIAARLALDPAWRGQMRAAVAAGKHGVFRNLDCVRALETLLLEAVARP